uniref:Uncharacterized protein n=1 Tax=viral metagenome TaxID=1070528 RepID=A0A6H1ZNN7_9ZZZZ
MTKEEIKETTKLRLSGAYFFKTDFRTYIDMDSHLLRLDQARLEAIKECIEIIKCEDGGIVLELLEELLGGNEE